MAVGFFLIYNYTNPLSLTLSLPSLSRWTHHHPKPVSFNPRSLPISPAVKFPISGESRRRRGESVVTRAGPSTNTYILAFMLPFSLIVATVFAALRLSDKLDEKYLEEVRLSEALREAEDDDDDDDDEDYDDNEENDEDDNDGNDIILPLEEPVTPSIRNRPKRQI